MWSSESSGVIVAFAIAAVSQQPALQEETHVLEFSASGASLVDGKGPAQLVEYRASSAGALHIWTSSELDLFLRVEDAIDGRLLGEDDNSGGGDTPYLRLEVEAGLGVTVFVAAPPGSTGSALLSFVPSPETDETRERTDALRDALSECERLRLAGQFDAAREQLVGALDLEIEGREAQRSQLLADAYADLGYTADELGELALARTLFEEVLAARERTLPADHPDLFRVRANLSVLMMKMGELAAARSLIEVTLEAGERALGEHHPDLVRMRTFLGSVAYRLGDSAEARAIFEEVVAFQAQTLAVDHPDLLSSRGNLALCMFEMGDLAGARAILEDVLAGYERALPADHPSILWALGSLGPVMLEMGDIAGARAIFEEVVASQERQSLPADHPRALWARGSLAVSMRAMDEHAAARELFEEALEGYERTLGVGHPDTLWARTSLAASLSDLGDLAAARELSEEVLAQYEQARPSDPEALRARGNLGAMLLEMGEPIEARAAFQEVLEVRERTLPRGHPDLLWAQAALASSHMELGDLDGARAVIPDLCSGMRARLHSSLALASREIRQTIRDEDSRLASIRFWSEGEAELLTTVFELTETMRVVAGEAARTLSQASGGSSWPHILSESERVRRALNNLVAGVATGAADPQTIEGELTRLTRERDRLEREAARLLGQQGVRTRPVEREALAASLSPNEAAVGFRRLPNWLRNEETERIEGAGPHLFAHVLVADGTLTQVNLGSLTELEPLVEAWRGALGAPLVRASQLRGVGTITNTSAELESSTGCQLRRRLIDPILDVCGDGVQRLLVCPDDLVHLVPLDALPMDAGNGTRLGDRLSIVNEVSFARLLTRGAPFSGPPTLLAVGGVDYDAEGEAPDGIEAASAPIDLAKEPPSLRGAEESSGPRPHFDELAQTGNEAEAIATLFAQAYDGAEPKLLAQHSATKAGIFEAAPGKRYVHIATHGWFAPESVRSVEDRLPNTAHAASMGIANRVAGFAPLTLCGLALTGANRGRDAVGAVAGILTAEELCALDLSQCELAVLSACETNRGIRRAGQGIQSLQAALYAAGVRTSITSLWRVDDVATQELMRAFYTNLWRRGTGKAEALWKAKAALREAGRPVGQWAGWVLTGNPD